MPVIAVADNVEIFYSEHGNGPTVLILHGWTCDGADWSWLAADLAIDHRVVIVDLRGHGRSTQMVDPFGTAVAFAAAASAFAVYGMVATVQHATTRNRGTGHRWRPATEKSHRALVSHATTTAVSSSAPAAGSAHLEIPRVWTKSTLAAKAP